MNIVHWTIAFYRLLFEWWIICFKKTKSVLCFKWWSQMCKKLLFIWIVFNYTSTYVCVFTGECTHTRWNDILRVNIRNANAVKSIFWKKKNKLWIEVENILLFEIIVKDSPVQHNPALSVPYAPFQRLFFSETMK